MSSNNLKHKRFCVRPYRGPQGRMHPEQAASWYWNASHQYQILETYTEHGRYFT